MRETLENPPIILRASRTMNLLCLVVALTALPIILYAAKTGESGLGVTDYLELSFFLVLALFNGWQALSPSKLIASPAHLIWATNFGTSRWAWHQIENFRPSGIGSIACEIHTPGGSRATRRLGIRWEIGSVAAAQVLNDARARWCHA